MLLDPSPRKVRVSPARRPWASRIGLQVGEDLAGVEGIGQRVDYRHGGGRRHLGDPVLAEGTPHDRGHLPAQYPGRVGDRLAAPELRGLRVNQQRMAAKLGNSYRERNSGAGRWLIEQNGHGAGPGEGPVPEAVRLHRGGQVEHLGLLGGAEVVIAQEVPGHISLPAWPELARLELARLKGGPRRG